MCAALDADEPDEPFPHLNTREDFPSFSEDTHLDEAVDQIARSGPGS